MTASLRDLFVFALKKKRPIKLYWQGREYNQPCVVRIKSEKFPETAQSRVAGNFSQIRLSWSKVSWPTGSSQAVFPGKRSRGTLSLWNWGENLETTLINSWEALGECWIRIQMRIGARSSVLWAQCQMIEVTFPGHKVRDTLCQNTHFQCNSVLRRETEQWNGWPNYSLELALVSLIVESIVCISLCLFLQQWLWGVHSPLTEGTGLATILDEVLIF